VKSSALDDVEHRADLAQVAVRVERERHAPARSPLVMKRASSRRVVGELDDELGEEPALPVEVVEEAGAEVVAPAAEVPAVAGAPDVVGGAGSAAGSVPSVPAVPAESVPARPQATAAATTAPESRNHRRSRG
jgi:hypothetical protein